MPAEELQLSVEEEEGQLDDDDEEDEMVAIAAKEEEKQLERERQKEERLKERERELEERRKRLERFEKNKPEQAASDTTDKGTVLKVFSYQIKENYNIPLILLSFLKEYINIVIGTNWSNTIYSNRFCDTNDLNYSYCLLLNCL